MAQIEFDDTIDGKPVCVFADRFEEDLSVGIHLGPEEVWAETPDGQAIELSPKEEERLGIKATDIYLAEEAFWAWMGW
jgi:hypothetical protein